MMDERRIRRFWQLVEKTDSCWLWRAFRDDKGYGKFAVRAAKGVWKNPSSHRLSWALANGPIPPGMCVCHRCDNPSCVNPDHLFIGDNKANSMDMVAKKRHSFGTRSPHAKLTDELVKEIHKALESGELIRSVARRYGVSSGVIGAIRVGRSWRHVADTKRQTTRRRRGPHFYNAKLNPVAVSVIRFFLSRGVSNRRLARAYGVSDSIISKVKCGNTWQPATIEAVEQKRRSEFGVIQ